MLKRWLPYMLGMLPLIVPLTAIAAGQFGSGLIPCGVSNDPYYATECQACDFGQLIQNVIGFIITISIPITATLVAYAGFRLMTSGGSPAARESAKKIITTSLVAFLLILSAWVIVNTFIYALVDKNFFQGSTWSHISCVANDQRHRRQSLSQVLSNVLVPGGIYYGPAPQCSSDNPACSPAALEQAGFSAQQAAVMSCIAITENSGLSAKCNGDACGTFQIMLTANKLSGPSCAQYNNGNSTLDCPALCKGSSGSAVNTTACQPCVQAAQNADCNAESANALYQKSGYAPWTTYSDNKRSAACVQQYSNPTTGA